MKTAERMVQLLMMEAPGELASGWGAGEHRAVGTLQEADSVTTMRKETMTQ